MFTTILNKTAVLSVASVLAAGSMAQAAALINVSIQGSTDNGVTWSNSLSIDPGQSIQVRVMGGLAAVGASNTQGATTKTIASETQTATTSSDGIGSLKFDLIDGSTGTLSSPALATQWAAGAGAAAGTVSGQTLAGVRPILGTGSPNQVGPVVLETLNLTAGQLLSAEVLSGGWSSGGSGTFKINGGSLVAVTGTTETGTDPIVAFAPLTLTAAATPEPASLALLGLAVPAVLSRRRSIR